MSESLNNDNTSDAKNDALDLIRVRQLLDTSKRITQKGRDLLDEAVLLQRNAFELLPPGTRLRFGLPLLGWDFVVTLATDGKWICTSGVQRTEWVLEQWMRGNWTLDGQPPI